MGNILEDMAHAQGGMSLDELAREGARRMLEAALLVEVAEYIESCRGQVDDDGHALVVRNGRSKERKVTVGSGTIAVKAPRVNDRRLDPDGKRLRFSSWILPRYMRRSPKVAEVLPVLYLRGLSTGDFREALSILFGKEASGLSAATITRLTGEWESDYQKFRERDLAGSAYAYIWVDGVHFNVRLEDDRLCTLVIIGVRADGKKELIAVEDGYRESTESWLTVLRMLKRRGMQAPVLAVGDAALGFWAALREVWPTTREQRCWVHRIANVLDKLPKRLQSKAKEALHEIMEAETKPDALKATATFKSDYQAKYPKAVDSLLRDHDKLLTYFDFPAEHWRHLRTSNPVESAFATVRLRQRVTKGAGSRTKALTMAFKLLDMAEKKWRRVNGWQLVADVINGAVFIDGLPVKTDNTMPGELEGAA